MTALIDPALARLSASHMISSSIKWSFTGGEVDWMMNSGPPGAICLLPLGHLRLLTRRRSGGEILLALIFEQNHLFHSDSGDGVQGVGDVLIGSILAPFCGHGDEKPCASMDHFEVADDKTVV